MGYYEAWEKFKQWKLDYKTAVTKRAEWKKNAIVQKRLELEEKAKQNHAEAIKKSTLQISAFNDKINKLYEEIKKSGLFDFSEKHKRKVEIRNLKKQIENENRNILDENKNYRIFNASIPRLVEEYAQNLNEDESGILIPQLHIETERNKASPSIIYLEDLIAGMILDYDCAMTINEIIENLDIPVTNEEVSRAARSLYKQGQLCHFVEKRKSYYHAPYFFHQTTHLKIQ